MERMLEAPIEVVVVPDFFGKLCETPLVFHERLLPF
jgi:hypothetical protein